MNNYSQRVRRYSTDSTTSMESASSESLLANPHSEESDWEAETFFQQRANSPALTESSDVEFIADSPTLTESSDVEFIMESPLQFSTMHRMLSHKNQFFKIKNQELIELTDELRSEISESLNRGDFYKNALVDAEEQIQKMEEDMTALKSLEVCINTNINVLFEMVDKIDRSLEAAVVEGARRLLEYLTEIYQDAELAMDQLSFIRLLIEQACRYKVIIFFYFKKF